MYAKETQPLSYTLFEGLVHWETGGGCGFDTWAEVRASGFQPCIYSAAAVKFGATCLTSLFVFHREYIRVAVKVNEMVWKSFFMLSLAPRKCLRK